jgi:hypothetical protein
VLRHPESADPAAILLVKVAKLETWDVSQVNAALPPCVKVALSIAAMRLVIA